MGLFDRFRRRQMPTVPESLYESVKAELEEVRQLAKSSLREGMLSSSADPDYSLTGASKQSFYRSVSFGKKSNDFGRDFDRTTWSEMLRLAHNVYALRGDGYNIVEIYMDFIVGQEFYPKSKDPTNTKLQKRLDEIWRNPRNDLCSDHEDYIRAGLLEGELFLPCQMEESSKKLTIGWRPIEYIEDVTLDHAGRPVFLQIRTPDVSDGTTRTYFVLDRMNEYMELVRVGQGYIITERSLDSTGFEKETSVPVDGIAFYHTSNAPRGAKRGRSELLQIMDYINIHDEVLWSDVEREKLQKMFILDIIAKDVRSPEEAKQKMREMGFESAPTGPRVTCHNDKVEIDIKTPQRGIGDQNSLEQTLRTNIYGAKGLPELWSGSGKDSTGASSKSQDYVPLRRLRRKQREYAGFFETMINVMVLLEDGETNLVYESVSENKYSVIGMEVGGKDKQRGAAIMKDVTVALATARADSLISREAAHEVILQAAREAGFDISDENAVIPPEDEQLNQLKAETELMVKAKGGMMTKGSKGMEPGGRSRSDGSRPQSDGAGRVD